MLKTRTFSNALFIPALWNNAGRTDYLCDEYGEVILESCLIRGPSRENPENENRTKPDISRIAALSSTPLSTGKHLFLGGGIGYYHFGHAITEGVARFWAISRIGAQRTRVPVGANLFGPRRLMNVVFGKTGTRYVHAAVSANGLSHRNFLVTRKPTRLESVVVPQPSAVLRDRFYPEHLETTRKISEHFVPKLSEAIGSDPIYLSRSKLKEGNRKLTNEGVIERFMVSEFNAKVVYPELLTPRDAVRLFNEHDVFVGSIGSAFHNLLFRRTRRKVTAVYLTEDEVSDRNFLEIDTLLGVNAHYVTCCTPTSLPKEFVFDTEAAKTAIASVLNETAVG